MRVGHGSAPLPVPDGTPLGGYADRAGSSSGVLDELQVDCVTFDGRFALVVAEVVCINEDLAADVRVAVGLEEVWVCATHTHSGPDIGCVPGGGATPPAWRERIASAAAAAASAALDAELECAAELHTGELHGIGSPRGDDTAAARVSLDAIEFLTADGALRGVLAVVPVHPTVLPATSTAVSGDLTAATRRAVHARLGMPWTVVATGAGGDISTRRTRRAQTREECERLGTDTAAQLAALLDTPATPLWPADAADWSARRRAVSLPVREQDPAELGALRERLEREQTALAAAPDSVAAFDAGAPSRPDTAPLAPAARTLATALQGIDIAQRRPAWGAELPVALSAARLGRLRLLGIGGEPFHSFADDLRGADPTVVLGYCNGHVGYLPDAAAYAHAGYEVLSSPFGPDAAAATVAALNHLTPTTRRTQ